jgi:xanthine dehydrogenase iron-sulfur cluster and FAD-binding subunit A
VYASLSFGGVGPTTYCALKTEAGLIGQPFTDATFETAYSNLALVCMPNERIRLRALVLLLSTITSFGLLQFDCIN